MNSPRIALRESRLFSGVIAVVGVSLGTGVFSLVRDFLGKGHAALLYLPVVVVAASIGGTTAGLMAALLAFFAWNFFFLPPYYTFVIHDPKDWISLFVFLLVGLAMGLQTGRMREREAEAHAKEEEASLLYRLGSELASQTDTSSLAQTLLKEITHTIGIPAAALFLSNEGDRLSVFATVGGLEPLPDEVRETAEWSYRHMKAVGLPVEFQREAGEVRWPVSVSHDSLRIRAAQPTPLEHSAGRGGIYLPLQATLRAEGVLYVEEKSDGTPFTGRDSRLLVSISHLASVILERQRLQAEASQADALREADRLKSTLVSSVSHELKTPLASVTARITNLLETDVDWRKEELLDELQAVDEDLDRLNNSIGDLLDLSRLEAGAWEPKREWHELGEILGTVVSRLPKAQRERIVFDLSDQPAPLYVDYGQMTKAIHNVLENALLYSPKNENVRVGATVVGEETRIWVEDRGPGIPPHERTAIFQKFQRGSTAASVPSGTGLGLAIAAEIVRYHQGRIDVEPVMPHGSRFILSLPMKDTQRV